MMPNYICIQLYIYEIFPCQPEYLLPWLRIAIHYLSTLREREREGEGEGEGEGDSESEGEREGGVECVRE